MLMEMSMKDHGSMTKLMVMEHTNMQMEQLILENGLKTNSTARALKLGQMGLDTTVCTKMARKMDKGH